MTKKDYIKIAGAIKEAREDMKESEGTYSSVAVTVVDIVAEKIAGVLIDNNERFDYVKFHRACGIE